MNTAHHRHHNGNWHKTTLETSAHQESDTTRQERTATLGTLGANVCGGSLVANEAAQHSASLPSSGDLWRTTWPPVQNGPLQIHAAPYLVSSTLEGPESRGRVPVIWNWDMP
ncbi:uncharacterized protein PGRI_050200 [Penicillium griseofulvum]|uniref:Uncharacterized protein n=1 Tax=Penicillium patulum TaxID=5078 RepID=A0A135LB37_PENPA|nr:uncharacterized protein PGRI_050200 [Penicillium griseofulvum]KXG46164.1 hypothetical protein PGRI_050200 [Penicillium griseofulvum]